MDNSVLNATKNRFGVVGLVSELDLKREDCVVKVKSDDGSVSEVPSERIRGKITLEIGVNQVKTFDVYASKTTSKGKEHQQWAMYEAMMNWNPRIHGNPNEEPTKVILNGSVGINDYLGQDGKAHSILKWNINSANTKVSPDEPLGCSLNFTGFVKKIIPEMRNDEETGRLNVELLGVDTKGAVYPVGIIVPEELVEGFTDRYEAGKTGNFDIDVVMVHVGDKKAKKKAFGKAASTNINTGFDIEERVMCGGNDPIEEPEDEDENGNLIDNGWLNPEAIKIAIKEREKMLTELEKNPPKKTTASASAQKTSKFSKKPDMNSTDDDDDFGF